MNASSLTQQPNDQPPVWLRYGIAILATALGALLRAALDPLLGGHLPFIMFFLAVLVTAWYGGFGPSILTIVLGSLAASFFFIPPRGSLLITGSANFIGWIIYLIVGLAMAMLAEAQRRERRRAVASANTAEQHLRELEREINQRERFEARLQESEAHFKALVDGAPMAIIATGLDGRVQIANEETKDLFGYEHEELLGNPVEMLIPESFREVHVKHRADYFDQPRIRPMGEDLALTGRHKDGSEFPIEVALSYVQTGESLLGLAFITDITERRQREEALRESEERFRTMANGAPVMIWMAGDDAVRTFFNQPWLDFTGRSLEQELGNGWAEGVHPDDYQRCLDTYLEAFRARESFTMEYRLRRKDGEYRWLLDNGVPRSAPQGAFEGYIGSCVDIHERKRAEQAQAFLTEVSDILASSLDYETTLASVARLTVPRIADWCAIDLLTEESVERVAVAHADADKLELAQELRRRYPPDLSADTGVAGVLRSGKPEVHWRIPQHLIEQISDDELREIIRGLGLRSSMIMPLEARGRVLGALTLVSAESGRVFSEADQELADELARRAALAVDNAQLYRDMNEQRERLRVTLASIGDAVIATDATGRVSFINGIAQSLTGWHGEDPLGQPVAQIFRLLNEKTGESVENPIDRVLRDGQVVGLANHTLLVTRDGIEIPIDDSGAPIRNERGQIVGAVLVFRDITARREAQKQIEESLTRTLDLYDISRQISSLSTAQGILATLIESRYLKDISQANVVVFNRPWDDRKPDYAEVVASWSREPEHNRVGDRYGVDEYELAQFYKADEPVVVRNVQTDSMLSEPVKELLASLKTYSMIFYPLVAAGQWYGMLSIHWSEPYSAGERITRHIQGLADQVAGAIYNSRLLESEAEARRAAEEANALKLKFLAMISHELRTPLTSIQGFASTLLADDIDWDSDSQRDFIQIISEESDKLTDLISQLLDLSRLEAGMLAIKPQPQGLDDIVGTALPQLTMLTGEHELDLDVPERVPAVNADADRIGQVLSNLVGNAARYAPPETHIGISARVDGHYVVVRVSDEGPGIPPEERERVFEAFRQANNRPEASTQGAGLGLAIARGLIEAHGGRIWIEERPGPGTTVAFTLPIANRTRSQVESSLKGTS